MILPKTVLAKPTDVVYTPAHIAADVVGHFAPTGLCLDPDWLTDLTLLVKLGDSKTGDNPLTFRRGCFRP